MKIQIFLCYKVLVLCDKIPCIRGIPDGIVIDDEARDNDLIRKEDGKREVDASRHGIEPDIVVDDKVLLKNVIFSNKPNFGKNEY